MPMGNNLPDPQPGNLTFEQLPTHVKEQYVLLKRFADVQAARYGTAVYLVGSALSAVNDQPRDWDVRCVLPDDVFERLYGPVSEWCQEPYGPTKWRWVNDCTKQTKLAWSLCPSLYVDFSTLPLSRVHGEAALPRHRLDSDVNMLDVEGIHNEPVHEWFSLTYASYLVLNRSLLQSMPHEWQARFVRCLEELNHAFSHLQHPDYNVQAGEWHSPHDLGAERLKALGWAYNEDQTEVFDPEGNAFDPEQACVFIPAPDPIPPYDRGRTVIPMRNSDEEIDARLKTQP